VRLALKSQGITILVPETERRRRRIGLSNTFFLPMYLLLYLTHLRPLLCPTKRGLSVKMDRTDRHKLMTIIHKVTAERNELRGKLKTANELLLSLDERGQPDTLEIKGDYFEWRS